MSTGHLDDLVDVLKAAIHALPEERHDSVRSVAQQHHTPLGVPVRGAHGAQDAAGVLQHLLDSALHAANHRDRLHTSRQSKSDKTLRGKGHTSA